MMVRRLIRGAVVSALLLASFVPAATAATATSLLLSQSAAFAILGHSCGGIQEQAFATGFAATSGYPIGDVYLQTRCGGSGRGGGYKVTTYSAWVAVTWDFSGAARSTTTLTGAPTGLNPTLALYDSYGDEVYNLANRAYLSVPVPAAPTGVTATPSGGQYLVSWSPGSVTPATLAFTVVATPTSTAPVVTATAPGTATSALLGPLQPLTTYNITVTSTDAAGTSPASSPAVQVTTSASSQPPSAPTSVSVHWSGSTVLVASWSAAAAGDSPVDAYQVTATVHDGGSPVPGPYSQSLGGSSLTTSFTVDSTYDWSVQVRAHNAAGWGPWSSSVVLGGL